MKNINVIGFRTKNDVNGNPRRLYAVIQDSHHIASFVGDDTPCLPKPLRNNFASFWVEVAPSEWHWLKRKNKCILLRYIGVSYSGMGLFEDINIENESTSKRRFYFAHPVVSGQTVGDLLELVATEELCDVFKINRMEYYGTCLGIEPEGGTCPIDEEWVVI